MVLVLAAGQLAGCAGNGTEGERATGQPLGDNSDFFVGGAALLSIIAAGIAASAERD